MNQQTRNPRNWTLTAIGAIVASAALVGCSRNENPATNDAMAKAGQQAAELKADAVQGIDKAKQATREMAANAKQATHELAADAKVASANAGQKINATVADARITTEISAGLAKDSDLSALKIDVDTDAGRVALHGTAPSTEARQRASKLASDVKGVVSVDNQLTVSN